MLSIRNLTGYDRKTIRKYLLAPAARAEYSPSSKPAGKLDPLKEYLASACMLASGMRECCCANCVHGTKSAATRF